MFSGRSLEPFADPFVAPFAVAPFTFPLTPLATLPFGIAPFAMLDVVELFILVIRVKASMESSELGGGDESSAAIGRRRSVSNQRRQILSVALGNGSGDNLVSHAASDEEELGDMLSTIVGARNRLPVIVTFQAASDFYQE